MLSVIGAHALSSNWALCIHQINILAKVSHHTTCTAVRIHWTENNSETRSSIVSNHYYLQGIASSNSLWSSCNHCINYWVCSYRTCHKIYVNFGNCTVPAHDPYFLRFILDIPKGVRKKAQKSPARAFRTLNVNQDSHRTPTTEATSLHVCACKYNSIKSISTSYMPVHIACSIWPFWSIVSDTAVHTWIGW